MSPPQKRLSPFSYSIWKQRPEDLCGSGRKFLLAISGGEDSAALVELFSEWSLREDIQVAIGHVHHGLANKSEQQSFRDRCQDRARSWAQEQGWSIYTNESSEVVLPENADEQSFRNLRRELLTDWAAEFKADAVVFAHHRDDLLETRLIRLIRGTGPAGFCSMRVWDGFQYRPFLGERKSKLLEYAKRSGCVGEKDPSHSEMRFMRNWLRRNWLQPLEGHRPGATQTLMQSFDRLAEAPTQDVSEAILYGVVRPAIDRSIYKSFSKEEKECTLFRLLELQEPFRRMTLGQCHEVLKRLETEQKILSFEVSGLRWEVNAERIEAIPS